MSIGANMPVKFNRILLKPDLTSVGSDSDCNIVTTGICILDPDLDSHEDYAPTTTIVRALIIKLQSMMERLETATGGHW
jgi:hypothetical protein